MSKNLSRCTYTLDLSVILQSVLTQNTAIDALQSSADNEGFPEITGTMTHGTGADEAKFSFHDQFTFAAGDTDINLITGTRDKFGDLQAFTLVKYFMLRIVTPATGKYLLISPGATDGWTALFNAGTTDAIPVKNLFFAVDQIDGYAVTVTDKVLRINNPGATAIVADLVIVGE